MEILNKCPNCEATSFSQYLTSKDYSVSQEVFSIDECNNCHLIFTNPRPAENAVGRYYESPDYISHSDTDKGLFNKLYHLLRSIAVRNKIRLIQSLTNYKPVKILDIGCGTGTFLEACKEQSWIALGVEPNENARKIAQSKYNLEVSDETLLNQLDAGSIDVITMWHVLEHVHLLHERLIQIHRLLKTGGILIIAVPNHESYDARYYQKLWAAYDLPRHLYHFSPSVIKDLLSRRSFKFLKSFPMKFDSYYVSLLSEKYKKSSLGSIKAATRGFLSNLKAGGNPEKYSSVIYVFQKEEKVN